MENYVDEEKDDSWFALLSGHYPLTKRYWRFTMSCLLGDCGEDGFVVDDWCVRFIVKPYQQYQLPSPFTSAKRATTTTGSNKRIQNDVTPPLSDRYEIEEGEPQLTKPCRAYHVLSHVESMLRTWEEYRNHYSSSPIMSLPCHDDNVICLLLAIFFHDVVYDARRPDNEEESVEWFRQFWDTCVTPTIITRNCQKKNDQHEELNVKRFEHVKKTTSEWILQTKQHLKVEPIYCVEEDSPKNSDQETQSSNTDEAPRLLSGLHVFLDLDLSVLGTTPFSKYLSEYASLIEEEYKFLGMDAYLRGRLHFLQSVFLPHKQWYKTAYFYRNFEAAARQNVAQEVELLKNRETQQLQ